MRAPLKFERSFAGFPSRGALVNPTPLSNRGPRGAAPPSNGRPKSSKRAASAGPFRPAGGPGGGAEGGQRGVLVVVPSAPAPGGGGVKGERSSELNVELRRGPPESPEAWEAMVYGRR